MKENENLYFGTHDWNTWVSNNSKRSKCRGSDILSLHLSLMKTLCQKYIFICSWCQWEWEVEMQTSTMIYDDQPTSIHSIVQKGDRRRGKQWKLFWMSSSFSAGNETPFRYRSIIAALSFSEFSDLSSFSFLPPSAVPVMTLSLHLLRELLRVTSAIFTVLASS